MTEEYKYLSDEVTNNSADTLLSRMYLHSEQNDSDRQLLDEEEARKEAKKLYAFEEEIVKIIIEGNNSKSEDAFLHIIYKSRVGNLSGLGIGNISFVHFMREDFTNGDLVGVHSPNKLVVNLHTDLPTLNSVKRIRDKDTIDKLTTEYFFDTEGNYGKLVFIPDYVSDDRIDAFSGIKTNRGRTVIGNMTSSDFKLAGKVLQIIRNDVVQKNGNVSLS